MTTTPAEDLAAFIWPDTTPEQMSQLSGALLRAFQKLKPAPYMGCETFLQKNSKKTCKTLAADYIVMR